VSRRIVLDTSAYSHLIRRHAEAINRVSTAASVLVPTIVIGELIAGFHLGSRPRENEVVLDRFLAEPFVSVVAVDREAAVRFGELVAELKRRGKSLPSNDVWIAAVTFVRGAELLTFDGDFGAIPGLSWTLLKPM